MQPTGYNNNVCQSSIVRDTNGEIILNSDGTVSFTNGISIVTPTLQCCTTYSTTELPLSYYGGNCYWADYSKCSTDNDVKVTLGIDGNNGIYLLTGTSENSYFQVEFDMLINFDSTIFLTSIENNGILNTLSGFTIDASIETATGLTPTTLQTYRFFNFDITKKPTGIYFNGQESSYNSLINQIRIELGDNCEVLTNETFEAKWTNVKFRINDSIIGKKIKLGFIYNNLPSEFNFLVDNIKINKVSLITNKDILNITNCPGFDLDKIVDNKKSWTETDTKVKRVVNNLDFRETSYYENDSRLLINSKEIDLTIDVSKAIDNDIMCYIGKNDCFYTGNTGTTIIDEYLINYKDEIDVIDDVNEFRDFVLTRLIDPKSRQVIRSYPLLRYVFDKYLNLCGLNGCEDLGNQYNYDSLNDFIKLIGDYWINLVEQFVPSTSLWKGATRFYRNSVFDQPKFKYKNYSLLTCNLDEIISGGTTTCEITYTPFSLLSMENLNTNYNFYLNKITECWNNSYTTLPPSVINSINSSGHTLNLATINLRGISSGNTVFNELILTGNTIASITGLTYNQLLSSFEDGLNNAGYDVFYEGENIRVVNTDENYCGEELDIKFCVDLSLSCISGGTTLGCVPYSEIDVLDLGYGTNGKYAAYCPVNNSLYIIDRNQNNIKVIVGENSTVVATINGYGTLADIAYNPINNSMYVLQTSPLDILVIDCTTNIMTPFQLPSYFSYNEAILEQSRIIYNSTDNKMYCSYYYGLLEINCSTNDPLDVVTIEKPFNRTYNGYQMTYCSYNNSIYIANEDGVVDYVSNGTYSRSGIYPLPNFNRGIGYNPTNNTLYSTSITPGAPITLIDPTNNTVKGIIPNTNTSPIGEVIYSPLNDDMIIAGYNNVNFSSIDVNNNLTNRGNLSSLRIGNFIYNSTDEIFYATVNNGDSSTVSIICVGESGISGTGTTITTNCETCTPLFSNTFSEVISSGTTIFDSSKLVGYQSDNIEVIIEPILLTPPTGSTQTNCIEISNKTICSKIYIKEIDDDVMYYGTYQNLNNV